MRGPLAAAIEDTRASRYDEIAITRADGTTTHTIRTPDFLRFC